MSLRRFVFGLSTLFGLERRGFFIPYRHAASVERENVRDDYGAIGEFLEERRSDFAVWLDRIDAHALALEAIGREPPPAPRWNQDWFPRLDAAIAYTLVRDLKPKRIVEIGSGHSTRFMARAIADGKLATDFVAVDPEPRATISGLAIECRRTTLDPGTLALAADLGPGDVLFVDSSHILMPGTDVDIVLNRILPRLAPGVLVHFHDIFLPEAYPASWEWRGYNEQQAVATLVAGGGYEIMFASRFVATAMAERASSGVLARLALLPGAYESSLWLRKN